ncbi:hypothetical protein ACLOAV_004568 [Pseudogymnoascus australis]
MGRTAISLELFNVLYFPCDISSVAFSFDSNYLAVAGEEGLVVFQANTQLSMFEPIARDVQKGVSILALQWTTSNSIEYLCLEIKDRSLQIHRRNVSPVKSELVKRPDETSYTIDSRWSYSRTPWQRGNKPCRYEFGANGGYFAGVSHRSVEIFKSSSKSEPRHGFMSDFTPKEEIISNIVNNIQQRRNQDGDSNEGESLNRDRYLGPDVAQKQHLLKRDREEDEDEDEESLRTGKKPKPNYALITSKRDREGEDEDEESLRTGKKPKPNYALITSKRDREDEDKDEESLPTGKKPKPNYALITSKRDLEEDKKDSMDKEESKVYDKENQNVEKTPLP